MLTHDLSVSVFIPNESIRRFRVDINAYHVRIYDTEHPPALYFKRTPDMPEWCDAKHSRITKALAELEKALAAAVEVHP